MDGPTPTLSSVDRDLDQIAGEALSQAAAHVPRAGRGQRAADRARGQESARLLAELAAAVVDDRGARQAALAALCERMDQAERTMGRIHEDLVALSQRIGVLQQVRDQLEAPLGLDEPFGFVSGTGPERSASFTSSGTAVPDEQRYRAFEDLFRGSEELIRERQLVYVDLFRNLHPVVDIGCGRGEFLDALAARGVAAVGVDSDKGMVDRCRSKGHEVHHGDALSYLESLDECSVGGVFAAQVVEHLDQATLVRFIDVTHRVLSAGGCLVAETVNPHSLVASKAFWLDRTHHSPVYPEVALALVRAAGFGSGRIRFSIDEPFDEARLRSPDYAVVATKSATESANSEYVRM